MSAHDQIRDGIKMKSIPIKEAPQQGRPVFPASLSGPGSCLIGPQIDFEICYMLSRSQRMVAGDHKTLMLQRRAGPKAQKLVRDTWWTALGGSCVPTKLLISDTTTKITFLAQIPTIAPYVRDRLICLIARIVKGGSRRAIDATMQVTMAMHR